MAYTEDKEPSGLSTLTSLATDDTFIVGDTSDTSEDVKTITKANLITDLSTSFAATLGADDNYVTDAEKTKLSNLSGTNTGDQTSIVGITGTKAQFDTAVTDGNILYVGDVTQYTDELAQDAVGGMTANSTFVSLAYNDATPSLTPSLSATGTPSASTYLRGDNTWATISAGGDVSKVGTPLNNQIGVWTGDGTIEGDADLTFDTVTNTFSTVNGAFSGDVTVVDEAYDATAWNGSLEVPTKNAIRDKIETLSASSGITRTVVVTSGNATAGSSASTDYVYFVAGAHTISLPAASGNTNRYTFKNNHSANVTVDTSGAETIDGAASISLAPEEAVDIISNGTNYMVV